ncbi:MAG: DinB family protein [Lautropia sp.]
MFTPLQHAGFNTWANGRLHAACALLPEQTLAAERGAYFKSILGTLNHILLVDILYMDRLTGSPSRFRRLDEPVCQTFAELRPRQHAQDRAYADYFAAMSPTALDHDVTFRTLLDEPQVWTVPMRIYLANLFQHQAHHRGQAHNLLSQEGVEPPPIGFVEYAIEAGIVPPPAETRR